VWDDLGDGLAARRNMRDRSNGDKRFEPCLGIMCMAAPRAASGYLSGLCLGSRDAGNLRASSRQYRSKRPSNCRRFERVGRHQPRQAAVIAAMSIFFIPIIASNARFASSPPAASASVSARGVICHSLAAIPLDRNELTRPR
jgi:hypothetical protein